VLILLFYLFVYQKIMRLASFPLTKVAAFDRCVGIRRLMNAERPAANLMQANSLTNFLPKAMATRASLVERMRIAQEEGNLLGVPQGSFQSQNMVDAKVR
jgi:hypothetical protein